MFRHFKTLRMTISIIVILQFGFLMPLAPVLAQEAADLQVESSNVATSAQETSQPTSNIEFVTDSDSSVSVESIQIDTGSTESNAPVESVSLDVSESSATQASDFTLSPHSDSANDDQSVVITPDEREGSISETIALGSEEALKAHKEIVVIREETGPLDESRDREDTGILDFTLDTGSDDVPVSIIDFVAESDRSVDESDQVRLVDEVRMSEEDMILDIEPEFQPDSISETGFLEDDKELTLDLLGESSNVENRDSAPTGELDNNQTETILDNSEAAQEVFESILGVDIKNNILKYTESEEERELNFEVEDEFKDIADLGDGKKVVRIYSVPREIFEDERGVKQVRPDGWNRFNEDDRSKLRVNNERGYEFSLPFSDGSKVLISSGEMEVVREGGRSDKNFAKKSVFDQRLNEDQHTVSAFREIYSGVDVNFIDKVKTRSKEIIIKNRPDYIQNTDKVIFWEEYRIPENSIVMVGEEIYYEIVETGDSVSVLISDDESFVIGNSIVYDSKYDDESYCEMSQIPIKQIIDFKDGLMRIGLVLTADYLLSEERVYPVVIDPTYSTYAQTNKITDFYLKWLTGKSTESYDYLFMGYDYASGVSPCSPSGYSSRHVIFKFDVDDIPDGSTVTDADVFLKGTNTTGCGEYSGSISMKPKRINTPGWTYSNISYNNIRSTLTTGGTAKSIDVSSYKNSWTYWDIYNSMVQEWVDGTENYGFLIEPSDNFSSGSTPPSSWSSKQRLFAFYSSDYNSSNSPYLEVDYTEPSGLPDLTSANSSNFNPKIVYPGETTSIGVAVKNIGTAAPGQTSKVYYYLRNSDSCSFTNTYKIGESIISNLQPGNTYPTSINYTIPAGTSPGLYKICYYIDGAKIINESNESNNDYSLTTKLEVLDNTPSDPYEPNNSYSQAEYIGSGTSYSWSDSYLTADDEDWFRFVYDGSSYYFKVRGYSSGTTGKYGVSFTRSGSVVTIETIEVDTNTDTFLELYDSNGSSELADDDDGSSNGNFSKLTYDLNPILYELQPSNGNIITNGTIYTGDTIEFEFQIENSGSANANGVYYNAQLYNINTGDTTGLVNLSPNSWNIDAGDDFYKIVVGQVPDTCSLPYEGDYEVRIEVDSPDDFAESNENNNIAYTSDNIHIVRYSYCGSGGGSSPSPDYDDDGYSDIEEGFSGTNVVSVDNKPVYHTQYASYMSKPSDKNQGNYGADPVNIRTGAFEFNQTDFALSGRGFSIDFNRTYNSKLFERSGKFGNGWTTSYSSYYYQDPDTMNVQVYLGGALAALFTTSDGGQTFTPPVGEFDSLVWDNGSLVYKTLEGVKYVYSKELTDNLGILEQIVDTNNNITTLTYTDVRDIPLLTAITDPSGRSLEITYGSSDDDVKWDKIVQIEESVNSSDPRIVTYYYDGLGRLIQVQENNSYQGATEYIDKYFDYDVDDRLMTYTDPRGTILYNEYDTDGRVIKQYEYNPNVDAVGAKRLVYELEYQDGVNSDAPGSTHCTNVVNKRNETAFYQTLTCFNADELKIYTNMSGNKERWVYDTLGMPTQYTDKDSNIYAYEYDTKRRMTKKVLPEINNWQTEQNFTYENNFNRLTKEETVSVFLPTFVTTTKTTEYTIDSANGNILSILDPLGNSESFTYDIYGNVATYTDKNGNVTTYGYDAGGNYKTSESITVTKPDGATEAITKQYLYDEYGHVTQYTTPEGHIYTYQNDTRGNLRRANNSDWTYRDYTYDKEDHRISETDELGNVTTYEYDKDIEASLIKVEQLSDSGNIITQYEYDWVGNLTKEIDPLGREITYSYNYANNIIEKQEPYLTTSYSYNSNNQIVQENNTAGEKTAYTYDSRRNLLETKNYTTETEYISNFNEYDGFDRVVKTTDGNGGETIFEYDLLDRVLKTVDALNYETIYSYDNNGNLVGQINPRAVLDVSLKNSLGHSISYEYDELNRLIKETNTNDKETIYYYDGNSSLVKLIDRQNNDGTNNSHELEYVYDNRNRKIQEKDAYGKIVSFTYDDANNLLSRTDEMNRTSQYNYGDFNRLISEADPAGNVTSYNYDKNGNKTSVTYPENQQTTYLYDNANRLIQVKDDLNNTRVYSYDAVGNRIAETDKRNYTTTFDYDKLGRLLTEVNPQGVTTTYSYDNNSNRLIEDVAGKIKSYAYDDLNRLTQIAFENGGMETYTYDEESNLIGQLDEQGNEIVNEFDNLNRLTKKQFVSELDVKYTDSYEIYSYDNWDNILTTKRSKEYSGSFWCPGDMCIHEAVEREDVEYEKEFVYDLKNRLVSETNILDYQIAGGEICPYPDKCSVPKGPYTIARTYNLAGDLSTLTDAAGKLITYEYDNRGLLLNAKDGDITLASYIYTPQGKPEVLTYNNGVTTDYTYDDLHRLTKLEIDNSEDENLFTHEYSYDAESNRTQLIENGLRTVNYTYDNLEQLTGVNYSDLSETNDINFSYDAWGNRVNLTTPLGTTEYTYATDSNELLSYTENGRLTVGMTYDNNGSLTQETYSRLGKDIKNINYSWDTQNRLDQIDYNYLGRPTYLPSLSNNIMQFTYDDYGNRIKKTVNSESSYYINDGLRVLNELDSLGNVNKSIVAGLGQVAEIDENGIIQYIHTDVLGSTVLITDEQGEVVAEYEYDVFGSVIGKSGLAESNYLFTNQEYDPESELYYYNARYYNTATGRFISRDPVLGKVGDSLTRNGYIYVKNNPLKYTDPTGEEEMEVCSEFSNSLLDKQLYWEQGEKSFIDKHGTKILDGGQFVLDLVGLVPGFGEPADGINALIYEARGDHLNAGLSAGSMIPFVGWLGTGGKFVNKAVKYGDEGATLVKGVSKSTKELPNQIHHVATDKSKKFTPEFKKITDKYNLNLDDDWNKVELPHKGRHPNNYHDFILDSTKTLDKAANGATDMFLKGFNKIKEQVKNTPEMLRKAFWE